MSNTPEEQTEPAASSADATSPASTPSTGDDLRDKFRAALDRKHGKGGIGSDDHAAGGSKASDRTSNSKRQREFRRKSGG